MIRDSKSKDTFFADQLFSDRILLHLLWSTSTLLLAASKQSGLIDRWIPQDLGTIPHEQATVALHMPSRCDYGGTVLLAQ